MTKVKANFSSQRSVVFSCKAPPPALKEVLREMGRGKGYVPRAAVMDLAMRANNRYYHKTDRVEALIKFLIDVVVVVEDPTERRLYLVRTRVKHILESCELRQDPEPSPYASIALVEALRVAQSAEIGATASVPLTVPLGQAARVTTSRRKPAPVPAVVTAVPSGPRYVMYLDPFEENVWRNLTAKAKMMDKELRVAVTRDHEARQREWSSGTLCCTPDEYHEAFVKFVKADIIAPVGTSGNGHDTYRFLPVFMDKKQLDTVHGTNESIETKNYLRMIQFYSQLIKNVQ